MSKELERLNFQVEIIRDELNKLSSSDVIKRYNRLKFELHELLAQRNVLLEKEKHEEFSKCNHIWIKGEFNSKYCLKCGLNTMYNGMEFINYDTLNLEEKIIVNCLSKEGISESLNRGTTLDYNVDNMIIYDKYHELKEEWPQKNDDVILYMLKEELKKIETDTKRLIRTKEE